MLLKYLIFAGIANGCFLILLLNTKKNDSFSDRYLMAWLGLSIFQLSFFFDSLVSSAIIPLAAQILGFYIPLLGSAVFYLYIYSLAFGYQLSWPKSFLHLVPYLFFCVLLLWLSYSNPSSIAFRSGFPIFGQNVSRFLRDFLTAPLALVPAFYTIVSIQLLAKYQKLLLQNYSFTERISLNWLKWVVISLPVFFVLLFCLIKFGIGFGVVGIHNLFAVVGSIQSFYVFFIGFLGLRQTTTFVNNPTKPEFQEDILPKTNYKNSGLSEEMVNHRFEKLLNFMDEKKPFLEADISLNSLAQQLGWTPNQLSQIINQKTASNFFDFINGYRVEAVKEKLKDPQMAQYTIIAIAFDCGFQSKSSFNKIFKEMVGKTPLEYQKS
jgi:AraC-like DNA-binding protein